MNAKLNTDTYNYRLNEVHRQDVMRAAQKWHLAKAALDDEESGERRSINFIKIMRVLFARGRHFGQPRRSGYALRRMQQMSSMGL